jgi:Uma2 family endonuclease
MQICKTVRHCRGDFAHLFSVSTELSALAKSEIMLDMSTVQTCNVVLRPELAGIYLTPDEFDAVEEAERGYRYELINGRLIVTPPPLEAERDPNEELGYLLRSYRDSHPQGSALNGTLSEQTVVTQTNRRRADRVIWTGLGRQPDPKLDLPSIVAEWVSQAKRDWLRDYVEKRQEYQELGIAEYWVFDRFRRILSVYRGTVEAPEQLVVHEGEVYRTPLLPGFELPLARLLAVADRWQ